MTRLATLKVLTLAQTVYKLRMTDWDNLRYLIVYLTVVGFYH